MRILRLILAWTIGGYALLAGTANAQTTYTWGGGNGEWTLAANWSPNGMPGPGDHVIINSGTVTLNSDVEIATLQINDGSLDGSGTLAISGSMTWSDGRMEGSGTTRIKPTATLTFDGSAFKELNERTLQNEGTVIHSGGDIRLSEASAIVNAAGGNFEFHSNALIDSLPPNGGIFTNNGTLTKTAGGGVSTIDAGFTNNGTVQVNNGTLRLSQSSAHFSNLNVATGAELQFTQGFHIWNGMSLLGGGIVKITNANIRADGGATITPGATLLLDGNGGISADGPLTVNGLLQWEEGTISGNGDVIVNSALDILSSNAKILDQRVLQNHGTVNLVGSGELRLRNNALLQNLAGSTLNLLSDADIAFASPNGGQIENGGIITKQNSNGTTAVEVAFINSGTVFINSGTFTLESGCTNNSATYSVAAGSGLKLNGGTFEFDGGSVINGGGDLSFASGILNFSSSFTSSGNFTIDGGTTHLFSNLNSGSALHFMNGELRINANLSVNDLQFDNGILYCDNDLNVNGAFTWQSGTLTGAGDLNLNGDVFLISNNNKLLDGQSIENGATMTWSGNGDLRLKNGAQIINLAGGVFDIQGNAAIDSVGPGAAGFSSSGTVRKSGGGGITTIDASFSGSGALEVQSGTLRFQKKTVIDNDLSVAPGTTLLYANTLHKLNHPQFSGGGTVHLSNATLEVSGDSLQVAGGTTFLISESSSRVQGSVAIRVDGVLNWERGFIATAGDLLMNGTLNFNGSNSRTLEGGISLINHGTINWNGSGQFRLKDNCQFLNQAGANLKLLGNAELSFITPSGGNLVNDGTITRSGSAGVMLLETPLTNNGILSIEQGTLQLKRSSTHDGASISHLAGTVLELDDDTHNFQNGTQVIGAGTIRVSGATAAFNNGFDGSGSLEITGGNVNLANSAAFNNLTLTAATLSSAGGDLTVSGNLNWNSGTLTGSGTLAIGGGLWIASNTSKTLDGWQLTHAGSGAWSGDGALKLRNNAQIVNQAGATLEISGAGELSFDNPNGGTFSNAGAIIRRSNPGTTLITIEMDNSGSITVESGSIKLTKSSHTLNGSYAVQAGALIEVTGGVHTMENTAISGAGEVRFDDVPLTCTGAGISVASPATLSLQSNGTIISGDGPLQIGGFLDWQGGTIGGSGALQVDDGLLVSSNDTKTLSGRTLMHGGSGSWSGSGDIRLTNGAEIVNQAGALLDILDNAEFEFLAPGGGQVTNLGTIRKSAGDGTTIVKVDFDNDGVLDIANGTVRFTTTLDNDSGTIQGSGTLDVSPIAFQNAGMIAPGSSPGILSVQGSYSQAADGILNIELGGVDPGSGYDRLAVSAAANLDGTVNINLTNNFFASVGDTFAVLTANSLNGQFATVNNQTAGNHVTFDHAYTAKRFVLTVTSFSNLAPLALNDDATLDEDASVEINVLANDSDGDNDLLTITALMPAAHGSISQLSDSLISYTPEENFFGADTFHYIIVDGFGGSDTAAVHLTVVSVNDPPLISDLPDSLSFSADSSASLGLWDFVSDIETADDQLSYAFNASNPGLIRNFDPASGVLTLTAAAGFSGEVQLIVQISDPDGGAAQDTIQVEVQPVVGVEIPAADPAYTFALQQNYPNPFNPQTEIRFVLAQGGRAELSVFNILGQKVRTLVDGQLSPGAHRAMWDGRNDAGRQLASGVYIYQLVSGNYREIKKMILLR